MKESLGLPLSGGHAAALDRYEQALHEYLCYTLDPLATVDAALADAPDFVMAHALRAYMLLSSAEGSLVPAARAAWRAASAQPHDGREAAHLRAIALWCDGQRVAAARVLEDIALQHPLDVLALRMGHLLDYWCGRQRSLHDRIARALPHWSARHPHWHAVLAMLAFGLEENGRYAEAERFGREAVAIEPCDTWARHAVVHVCEMQDRRADGIAWMRGATQWQRDSRMAVHNWWHLALHHLAQGDVASTLEIYDGPVRADDVRQQFPMADASALLWRLELAGAAVGGRWEALAHRWSAVAGEAGVAFNDWHAAMAFVGAGRDDLLKTKLQAQAQALLRGDDNARALASAGIAATHGLIAFGQQDYGRAVALLSAVRDEAVCCGGSNAQRDLLELTLLEAARRDGQGALAAALAEERAAAARARRSLRSVA